MSRIVFNGIYRKARGQLDFDADELRNIAYALGLSDGGAQEMLALADEVDAANGVPL